MTTPRQNPIDRTLDRLNRALNDGNDLHEAGHPILTDLVAELDERWQNLKVAVRLEDYGVMRDRAHTAEARLAAVVGLAKEQVEDYWDEVGTDNYYHGQYDLAVDILDLYLDEGGEHEEQAEAKAEASDQAGGHPGNLSDHAGGVEPAAPYTHMNHETGEVYQAPAAPDATPKLCMWNRPHNDGSTDIYRCTSYATHGNFCAYHAEEQSDATLDEIVRAAITRIRADISGANCFQAQLQIIRAACIRARETDEGYGQLKEGYMSLRKRLAAVREWREKWYDPRSHACDLDELDAILDGEDNNV